MRHFDVQLIGGMVLHEGRIAEMKTGEGKTLVATLPLYLNALAGVNVHLVTVNDYLARRDADWMGPIYEALGVTVGVIQAMMPDDERRAPPTPATSPTAPTPSSASTTCATTWRRPSSRRVQRGHYFAIVDEVDSILIDEARTPLIISGEPEQAAETYYAVRPGRARPRAWATTTRSTRSSHTASPDRGGRRQGRAALEVENLYAPENGQLVNHLIQAIKAKELYQRDDEYVVTTARSRSSTSSPAA